MVFCNPGRTTGYPDEQVEKGFRYHYLGGGNEVGNVGVVLEEKTLERFFLPLKVYRNMRQFDHLRRCL